ncbi:MBL fold metallo-hydrolase, partial [Tetragenococcus halophilus]|nr:MBL fold metallo-hydrolase [Tetragenococcus halophilus]
LVYIPEEKILFLGDATSEDFENDGYMDQEKLKSLIKVIEQTDCTYCMLGHAQPLGKIELVDYLKSINSLS